MTFTTTSTNTLDNLTTDTSFLSSQLAAWENNRTGELVLGPSSQFGWLRLPSNATIFSNASDPSAGPSSAHYELIFTDKFFLNTEAQPSSGNFFSIVLGVVSPSSRGSISLATTNSFDHPIINPNFLSTDFDIFVAREALKASRRFVTASTWNDWIAGEYGIFSEARTDIEIEQYARNTATSVDHVCGTVAMTNHETGMGALNSNLTVKGTIGLRVVDASAFPFVPAAHTQTPVYILAERAADLIKASHH